VIAASVAETISMAVLVTSITRRRSSASATTPLIKEKTMIGMTRTSPTPPSASAFCSSGTSSETCHRIAALRIIEPDIEMSSPNHSSRKLRWERAMRAMQNEKCEMKKVK